MNPFPMHALSEADLDTIVTEAGGTRAHPDADSRKLPGADYQLGNALVELKLFDDEGFVKRERQSKLAKLFTAVDPERPVVVLDPRILTETDQREYRRIVEGPVKNAISKARDQLVQSRREYPEATGSILWVINNGYMSLDHATLKGIVSNRLRQDTRSIDGVIVSGCYYHSDDYEGVVLWPMSYVPINVGFSFSSFEHLHEAWNAFANRFMTDVVLGKQGAGNKLAVSDITFDMDGITFVRPAPPMGQPSEFYINGRPRSNSSGSDDFPPVGLIVPGLSRADYEIVQSVIGAESGPLSSYERWQQHLREAADAALPTKPLVMISVAAESWLSWCLERAMTPSVGALRRFAHDLFDERMRGLLATAQERKGGGLLVSSYMLAVTEEIGQDRANDVSHIAAVRERPEGEPHIRPLVGNLRIFHEHALALAAAYALIEHKDVVLWQKDHKYSWT